MTEAAWELQHTDTTQHQKNLHYKMLGQEDIGICKIWLLLNEHCFTTSLSQIIPIASYLRSNSAYLTFIREYNSMNQEQGTRRAHGKGRRGKNRVQLWSTHGT